MLLRIDYILKNSKSINVPYYICRLVLKTIYAKSAYDAALQLRNYDMPRAESVTSQSPCGLHSSNRHICHR